MRRRTDRWQLPSWRAPPAVEAAAQIGASAGQIDPRTCPTAIIGAKYVEHQRKRTGIDIVCDAQLGTAWKLASIVADGG